MATIQEALDKVKKLAAMGGDHGFTDQLLSEVSDIVHKLDGITNVQDYIDARLKELHSELDEMMTDLDQ